MSTAMVRRHKTVEEIEQKVEVPAEEKKPARKSKKTAGEQ